MNIKKEIIYFLIGLIGFLLLFSSLESTPSEESLVKSGQVKLICSMKDGYKVINPDKVINKDSSGYWNFTNGYAKNCYLEKGKNNE